MSLRFIADPEDSLTIGEVAMASIGAAYQEYYPELNLAVEVGLMSPQAMQVLNHQSREIDEPTDVLSFPVFASLTDLLPFAQAGELLIGTIAICPEKVSLYGETLPQMLHHGLLHLLGYDHETDLTSWNTAESAILMVIAKHDLIIPALSHGTI